MNPVQQDTTGETAKGSLWGGRFKKDPAPEMVALSRSTHFDWRLAKYDLQATKAHAENLASSGYLTAEELRLMIAGIDELQARVASADFYPHPSDEDVHAALERGLIETLGAQLGGKIRAGRSRNDQIATFIRMYMLEHAGIISAMLKDLVFAIIEQAAGHVETLIPGRTHLQIAQPVSLAHQLAAHAWPLVRDAERLQDWRKRASRSPYGAAALAGATLGLAPEKVAGHLGLGDPLENSIDATAARDAVAEYLFIISMIGVNVSRFAEEIILWNTPEFGFIKLHDSYSTGSSIMPQKKNPDIAELARGKAGRFIGNLSGLMAALKGLPLAYNRDLQEDKEPVFDSTAQIELILPAFTGMVATAEFDTVNMRNRAAGGFALATDVAEWLVKEGVAFRQAHEISGELVAYCESAGMDLDDVTDAELQQISPRLKPGVREVFDIDRAVAMRDDTGGTAPARVREQLEQLRVAVQDMVAEAAA